MTPEEAHDRIADVLIDAGIWPHDCERVIAILLRERQALLVAMGGRQLPPRGALLTTPPDGDSRFVTGWVVPDE